MMRLLIRLLIDPDLLLLTVSSSHHLLLSSHLVLLRLLILLWLLHVHRSLINRDLRLTGNDYPSSEYNLMP